MAQEAKTQEPPVIRVIVTIERRDDGGLYVYSDDLPGFVLSHFNAHAVLADIEPVLSVFLSRKFGHEVNVRPMVWLREALVRDGMIEIGEKSR
jgi:hypothetical protein